MSPRSVRFLTNARVLWAALFASTLLLVVMVNVAKPERVGEPPPLVIPLTVVALVNAVVAVVLPAMQYRKVAARREFERAPDPSASPAGGYREGMTQLVFANPSLVIETLFPAYQTSLILGMALAESIALFGFVLVFQGHPLYVGMPFFAVCWGLQASKFPTLAKVVAPVEARLGAKFRAD